MNIIAHRGLWSVPEDKNTLQSFEKAFINGFGIETDIRDYKGKLVISHNMADSLSPTVEELFRTYVEYGFESVLALNVKADGMQAILKRLLKKYGIINYFLFDMSVPELVVNDRENLIYYTRHSDIENECVMYDRANGVWLDSFYNKTWLTENILKYHILNSKKISIVSPELHDYNYEGTWKLLKKNGYHHYELITLCTDFPIKAKEFFYE